MSKTSLCLISSVAALPGAFLAYLMVMVFLEHAGGSSGALKGLAGLALVVGATLCLMPFGILVFAGPKKEKKAATAKGGETDTSAAAATGFSDELEVAEDSGAEAAGFDEEHETETLSGEELAVEEEAVAEDLDEFEGGSAATFAGDEDDFEVADSSSDVVADSEQTLIAPGSDDDFFFEEVADDRASAHADHDSDSATMMEDSAVEDLLFDDEDAPPAKGKKKK